SNSMKASILPDSNDVIASDSVNAEKFDLRGLSLYKGDVIGIIGNHASGKTSLIKCLHEKTCTQLFEGENCVALISPEDFYARSNKLRSFSKILFAENPLLTNKAVLNSFTRLMDKYNLRTRVYQMTKDSLVFASLLVALTKKPDVILIDQAMEWLNDRQKRRFFDILLKYKPKECTIIVTDFSLERLAPHVDKIAFMVSGKVLKTVLTENLTNEYGKPLIWVLYEGDDHQTAHECFPLEHPLSREVDDILRKRKILALNTTSGITEEVFKRETGVDLNE
ncbi:MAG: hypothetical protein JXB20_00005, partial [Bacilli bacterium]|nr:hypothetical protein [Bacilli bacterium]